MTQGASTERCWGPDLGEGHKALFGSVQAPPSKMRTSQAGIQRPMLVTLCDARWASCKDVSSQDGMLTVLCDAFVLKGEVSRFTPIAWQSRKLPRVTRPSTSAEVQMASTTIDNHEFTKQIMIHWFNPEMLPPGEVDSAMHQIESVMVFDSKNMYDALDKVESSGLHLEEPLSF